MMKKNVIIVFCMIFSLFSCAQKQKFTSYSPAEFERLLQEDASIQLVDVRRPDEYVAGYIDKAILINVQEADFLTKAVSLLDKSKPVAVYCRGGRRSKEAAKMLTKKGFVVYELDPGYLGWLDYLKTK
ncbi:MAG: rhodanese-like domain-containing protein [Clostridiales bacterium]|jgi:rhodanese-related sulfurtransferase|nr:rhodanese-like domain-containing protein [Clostridiales bacterium]